MSKTMGFMLLPVIAITGCQCVPPQEAPPVECFMERLDTDGDGRVSTEEFDGRLKVFVALDVNKDSFISVEEAPSGSPYSQR